MENKLKESFSGCLGFLLFAAISFGAWTMVNGFVDLYFPDYNPPVDPPGVPIYEIDFLALQLDESGIVRIGNVHLESGERYSVYLVEEVEHGCPGGLRRSCFYTKERHEGQGIKLFDSRENRIANEMAQYTIYDGTSESSYQMATFTVTAEGNEVLILKLGEAVIMTTYIDRDTDFRRYDTVDLSAILDEPYEDLRSSRIVIRHEEPLAAGAVVE